MDRKKPFKNYFGIQANAKNNKIVKQTGRNIPPAINVIDILNKHKVKMIQKKQIIPTSIRQKVVVKDVCGDGIDDIVRIKDRIVKDYWNK